MGAIRRDCAYKLARIYRDEGDLQKYAECLEKSAESKIFDAQKEYAEFLVENGKYKEALAIYKELAQTFNDEESRERVVDLYERVNATKTHLILFWGLSTKSLTIFTV